ncbi:hypothetical protein BP6252_09314 [Coleophoma cylindrospora]|uniref:Cytochrome P450 n=1 Tax=Coleophoma cylindrospora TaxID=1849047 RepID=A0A3D8R1T7_9HELO|nr:hypothetical protein BP6252_09314 [Coleophoma cylindrospora]
MGAFLVTLAQIGSNTGSVSNVLVIFTVWGVLWLVSQNRSPRSTGKHEVLPGPRQIPVLGRIHDLPRQHTWLKFKEWAGIYGPIYSTSMLGAKFLILSDEKIVEDILVKRARIYSDRPPIRSLFDSKSTYGSMEYLPLMGKNKYWSRQRRWVHASLNSATDAQYHGVIDFEVKRWIFRLIGEPDNFSRSLEDMASKIICTLTWDDHSVSEQNRESAWKLLNQFSPSGPITNVVTPLWDLPLWANPWKRSEIKRHDEQKAFWMERFLTTREKFEKGIQRPCWTTQYIKNAKTSQLSGDSEAASCIGMLAIIGVFTISSPLHYFLMAMVHHQEWLTKCQREIDEACNGSMPTFRDAPNLPILRACINETMRWRPAGPLEKPVFSHLTVFYYLILSNILTQRTFDQSGGSSQAGQPTRSHYPSIPTQKGCHGSVGASAPALANQ